MKRQLQSRVAGECRAQGTLLRLLCGASIWRTIMIRILPLCGASAWWTTMICLLPGLSAAALLWGAMRLSCTGTLAEMLRACLGRIGGSAASILLGLLVMLEGVSVMTALTTLFTEGIGTRGTQLTLAILTGVLLLFSLHREGLPRAAHFLRWLIVAAALAVGITLLGQAKVDHLFPLHGDGSAAITDALQAGWSLAWPVALLLTFEVPRSTGRLRGAVLPAFCPMGAVLLLTLAVPHEQLMSHAGMAQNLLLPVKFTPNAVRIIGQSLVMLTFFLSIGASAQLAAGSLCTAFGRVPRWLSYVLVMILIFSQAIHASELSAWLAWVEPWLVTPLLILGILCLPTALLRRKKQ